jgi:hypothetical protein
MSLWNHYEVLTDAHRAELDALAPEQRREKLNRWHARRASVAAMRDAVAGTAGVLDVTVDLLILELKQQEDEERRTALVDFMIEICRAAACARAFVEGSPLEEVLSPFGR